MINGTFRSELLVLFDIVNLARRPAAAPRARWYEHNDGLRTDPKLAVSMRVGVRLEKKPQRG